MMPSNLQPMNMLWLSNDASFYLFVCLGSKLVIIILLFLSNLIFNLQLVGKTGNSCLVMLYLFGCYISDNGRYLIKATLQYVYTGPKLWNAMHWQQAYCILSKILSLKGNKFTRNIFDRLVSAIKIMSQFLKTILLGTMVNFLFYSLNEAPGKYLSCVKISA